LVYFIKELKKGQGKVKRNSELRKSQKSVELVKTDGDKKTGDEKKDDDKKKSESESESESSDNDKKKKDDDKPKDDKKMMIRKINQMKIKRNLIVKVIKFFL